MAWARSHKNDWDFSAAEAADAGWNYESVLNIYRRVWTTSTFIRNETSLSRILKTKGWKEVTFA